MRTSHNESVKDPRTTAISINEEALHKEEFEFKSQTKTERALKTLQRFSGLTTLLSTYQLIPMCLSLANDASSFNLISTSLASISLVLSLGLAYWSTRVLKYEQSRHLLSQELNLESLNARLFVALLMRAALSLVLIPNMILQSNNTPSHMVDSGLTTGQSSQINMARTISNLSVPLPLIELMIFFVFLSAAKTTFSHIKQSGRAMSSLIFFANIAMMGSALALVFSVLRLKAFPFQGNFAMIFPSWNLNGLLRLGAIASFTSFLVWLVNFRRWRVPSMVSTMIVGALVLSFTALSISGYSNANSVEREHGREFAHPYLGFSNMGMLSAVFGMLVFLGGAYFWKRHYNFIETNKRRSLVGFGIMVSLVLVFVAARGLYLQPFKTHDNSGYSTRTYNNVEAKASPQMTIREAMLSRFLLNDLKSLDKGIKDTTKDLNNVITLFENAKRRGFFPKELTTQLWSFTESLDNYEEYVPKQAATDLWALFGGLDNLQNQLEDASEGVAENSRAIRNYALQLWPWSKSLPEFSDEYKSILPGSGVVSQLWALFGSLDEIQASLDDAKLQLENTKANYQEAQSRALVAPQESTTEFWPWSSSLNEYESYKNILSEDGINQLWWFFNKVSNVHTQLKDAAKRVRGTTKATEDATTSLWPSSLSALSDSRNYVPREQNVALWSLFSSVNDLESSFGDVTNQLDNAQNTYQDAQTRGLIPEESAAQLWSAWANSFANYKTHQEIIPQAVSSLWSLFSSLENAEASLGAVSEKASETRTLIQDAQSRGVLPTEKTVEAWSSNWQDNLPSRMVTRTWFSGWQDIADNIPQDELTQAWGDHWSVTDKLPSFLRSSPTSQSIWNSDFVTEFPRDAATQLFAWFGKVNTLEDSINAAKEKVSATKAVLDTARTKGTLPAQDSTAELTQEQLMAFWSLFGSVADLKNSVSQASAQLKDTQVENLAATTELWPWSDSLNEYEQYKDILPKIALTEFWSLFGSSSELQGSLADSAQQIKDAQSQGSLPTGKAWNNALADILPKDVSTQLWGWFSSLSNAQSSISEANSKVNSMNNMMSSAQALGIVSKDANTNSNSLADTASKLNSMNNIYQSAQNLGLVKKDGTTTTTTPTPTPATTTTTTAAASKTGDLAGTLGNLQNQLNSANQKVSNIQSIYQNAQNLGLVAKPGAATPSELWTLSGALSDAQSQLNLANQKLYNAQSIYSSSQNLGLVSRPGAATSTELLTLWGYLTDAQASLGTANQKLNQVQSMYSNAQNLGLVSRPGATPSEFWSLSSSLNKYEEYVPKTTELFSLFSSLTDTQAQIYSANQKVNNMQNVYQNAQNLGLVGKPTPTKLWDWSEAVSTVDKYKEYLPAETVTAFWSLFGSVSDLQDTIADTNKQFQEAQMKGALPAASITEAWRPDWIDQIPEESATQLFTLWNSLSNVQTSLNTANQKINNAKTIYSNAENLGLVAKETPAGASASQLYGWPKSLDVIPSQLWTLWSSINDAQASLNSANLNLDQAEGAYKNAENLGSVNRQGAVAPSESDTTELWSLFGWLTGAQTSLNTANQKLSNVQSIYQNAENLGLVTKENTASNKLWTLSSSLSGLQSQISAANQKVSNVKSIYSNSQNLGLVNRPGAQTTQLWSLFGWLTGAQSQLTAANQKIANAQSIYTNAQNLGLVGKQDATVTAPTTELWTVWSSLSDAQASINNANQKLNQIQSISSNAQNLGLVSKQGATPSMLWSLSNSLDKYEQYVPKTTQLFSWFSNSLTSAQSELNNANQKLNQVQSIYSNAQNLGLVNKQNAAVPTGLWALWGSLGDAQNQLNAANQKVNSIKSIHTNAQSLGLIGAAVPPSQTTELWAWFSNSLNNVQSQISTANQKVANVKNLYSNAQNLGLVAKEGSTPTPTTTPTTELFALWGSLNDAQASLNTVNQKLNQVQNIHSNAQNLGLVNKQGSPVTPASTTELWAWFSNSLNSVQSQLNTANQKLNQIQSISTNAQNLGLIGKQGSTTPTPATTELWAWFSNSLNSVQGQLNSANQKVSGIQSVYNNAQSLGNNLGLNNKQGTTPPTNTPQIAEMWEWFSSSLSNVQNQLNAANQKVTNVKSIYSNAQNLGLVGQATTTATQPTELWSFSDTLEGAEAYAPKVVQLWSLFGWLTGAQSQLNTANQKITDVKNIYTNAQNLGFVAPNNANAATTTTTTPAAATPSQLWDWSQPLEKYEGVVPKAVVVELWTIFNSLSDLETSVKDANKQIADAQGNYENTQEDLTPEAETKLWGLFKSLSDVEASLNNATGTIQSAQNRGVIPSAETFDNYDSQWLESVSREGATEFWSLFGSIDNLENSLSETSNELQGVGVTYQGAQERGLVGKEGELTRLFWPFSTKSNLQKAKETVQEKAKTAYDAVASAASTSGDKAKSAYNSVSSSISSSAAELKDKAQALTNRAETTADHVKTDVNHVKTDNDHANNDVATVKGEAK